MTRLTLLGLAALALAAAPRAQDVTGLSGWSLYLDPGHSQTENDGIFGYSEAEKVLRVGLALREMLLTRTDIDTVYLSRTNDQEQVSLSQRTDEANSLGASFFHSIHSNAAAPTVNNVLMLYGGWRENGETVEKTPKGGARMGAEFLDALMRAMRLPAAGQGNFADRTFYLGFPDTHERQFPYLFVNRTTAMASVLSEGGFHTNPRQNQLNMNADWKRLEAQAHYWAILDYRRVARSTHRIATGIVTDVESGRPINGATVTVDGQTYTTDTFESLFNAFSDDPDELSNGFYYLEGVGPGMQTVTASAEGYRTATAQVTVQDTTFSFADLALVSTVAPVVTEARPADGAETFPITDPLRLTFSRPLDPETAAAAVTLAPTAGGAAVEGTVALTDRGYTLVFTPAAPLAPRTDYTLTVAGTATTVSGDALDGDGDGAGGDAFTLSFTSSFADTSAPRFSQSFPAPNAQDADLRPVVTVAFDEPVVPETLDGRVTLEAAEGGAVAGRVAVALAGVVGEVPEPRTTVSFVPDAPLAPGTRYRFAVAPGVEDRFGNASTGRYSVVFTTGSETADAVTIDDFESLVVGAGEGNWWVPQESGSTVGIVTDSTLATASPLGLPGSGRSLRIDYGWDDGEGPWLIREYLAGGPPRDVTFGTDVTLRALVFGDGVGTRFRFAVDDGFGGAHEVSPWVAVDWYGWRPVEWDLDADGFGTWIGNGAWDSGQLRFDSFQLGYDGTSALFGELYVDDLQVLVRRAVSTEGGAGPAAALAVRPVRPNPSRGRTSVSFALGAPAEVTVRVFNVLGQEVATLVDAAPLGAGEHEVAWDAGGVASGAYVVRVEAGGEVRSVRAVVAR